MASHSNPTALVSVDEPKISMDKDIEATQDDREYLTNMSVRSFGWEGVTVNVKDRTTKRPKTLLQSINGFVTAGIYKIQTLRMWVDAWHRRDARDHGSKVCFVHRTTASRG
jgi:hypothetical protein